MTDQLDGPTPQEAARALDSIGNMTLVALERGLHSRWFALSMSLWVGATTVAKAYDGPAANVGIAALLLGGWLGLAMWRRRIVARVRAVHGVVGTVAVVAMLVVLLTVLMLGDRAFEAYGVSWAPFATGGAVAAILFTAFEVERRSSRAKLMARSA